MSGDGFALESAPACMCGRRVPAFAIVPRIVPWSSLGMSCSWAGWRMQDFGGGPSSNSWHLTAAAMT
eukprot:scaffold1280_cov246-Pinguiococcus_pyrenoidosus.AAC.25